MGNSRLKVYCDNMIVSAASEHDLGCAAEQEALDKLLSLGEQGRIQMVTSRWSLREIERTQDRQKRSRLKDCVSNFELVPYDHKVLGFHDQGDQYGGFISSPLVSDDIDETMLSELRNLGLTKVDPHHLMVACHNKCDRFLTTDPVIIAQHAAIESLCPGIRIMKPSELLRELSTTP